MRIARVRSLLAAAAVLLCVSAEAAGPPPVMATIVAHPAIWSVHAQDGTAYLFGSIHLLPSNIVWRTPEVEAAIAASDMFVFEAPLDNAGAIATADFIREHGTLPPNVTLPSLLDDQTLKDYRKALVLTHVAAGSLAHMRPWLASLVLEVAFVRAEHYAPESGVDRQVFAIAKAEGKSVRYFESVGGQLSLLVPEDSKIELAEFDATLKQFQSEANEIGPLVDAWSHGQESKLGRLLNADLESQPGAQKTLIDDRNDLWLTQIKTMLAEHHTYFITVGAGHLAGPHGLPALLRAGGYRVEGP